MLRLHWVWGLQRAVRTGPKDCQLLENFPGLGSETLGGGVAVKGFSGPALVCLHTTRAPSLRAEWVGVRGWPRGQAEGSEGQPRLPWVVLTLELGSRHHGRDNCLRDQGWHWGGLVDGARSQVWTTRGWREAPTTGGHRAATWKSGQGLQCGPGHRGSGKHSW